MSSPKLLPKVSTASVFSKITGTWQPKMVALLNDDVEFRVARLQGEFVWHSHTTTDELFFILEGGPLNMSIRHRFDDSNSEETVTLEKGDIYVVPKGTQHLPFAENEVQVLVVEKKGELNTGDLGVIDRTAVIEDIRGGQ